MGFGVQPTLCGCRPLPDAAESLELTAAGNYLFDVSHSLAAALVNRDKKKGKAPSTPSAKPNQVNLYVANTFPRWKEIVLELLRAAFNPETSECGDQVNAASAHKLHGWKRGGEWRGGLEED